MAIQGVAPATRPRCTDALSNTVAFILRLGNSSSSSRDFQQWDIIVCHMSILNWLTGPRCQTGCWDIPGFDYCCGLKFSVCNDASCLSPSMSRVFHFCLTTFRFLMGLSQWPNTPVILSSTSIKLSPHRVHPWLHVSLPSCCEYQTKAPSQCVSNYMFLLEALVSCVASLFVSVARLGPDQFPQTRTSALPTAQEYHYHADSGLWQTTVTLGMTRTRLSDLCVWPLLP